MHTLYDVSAPGDQSWLPLTHDQVVLVKCMHACRHTTRFILVYTSFMPIVLWRNLEWGVFFVTPVITLLLAGIDNIGMHIENPFRVLPMAAFCRVIHENIVIAACDWAGDSSKVLRQCFPQSHNCL